MDLRNGPSITFYGEDAAVLEPYLRDFERKANAREGDDEAAVRVFAIRRLAAQWRGSANGTAELPKLDDVALPLQDDWQTTKEAGEALDIGQRAIRKAIAAGRLRGRKIGGAWQVGVCSVAAELERRQEKKGA